MICLRTLFLSVVVALALTWCHTSEGSPLQDEYAVRFVTGTITPPENTDAIARLSTGFAERGTQHFLVQLYSDPDEPGRSRLEQAGIKLLEPITAHAWTASLTHTITPSQARNVGVRWAKELQANDKLHPRVQRGEYGDWVRYEEGKVIVSVRLHGDVPWRAGENTATFYGAEVGGVIQSLNTLVIAIDPKMIPVMAAEDMVEWIDVLPPPLKAVNDVARQVVGANTVQEAPYGLDGSGITVCVYDAGLVDGTHNDFGGRVTAGEAGTVANHSTHVAGSVGGDGANSAGAYRGMAPGCDIVSYVYEACNPYCLYNSPQDIEANYLEAQDTYGAMISTNSIGSNTAANGYDCAWEGDYELVSQLLDNIVRGSLGNPFIVLFAAGNERGYETCGTTYSTMGVPGGAKNVITVGATNDADAMSSFSSWGPTDDGRTKPEVCAPGVNIHSTLPGNAYGDMSGTSMATPITSGCVALMLQQYGISYPGMDPMPSTIKALLVNSAVDLGNAGPDFVYGFGRINVQAAVDAVINGDFLEGQLSLGETNTHTFAVPPGTASLRVSLSWMDPAASPLANPTLVNDLDITLTSPENAVYYPYILNAANPSGAATTGVDHVNNTEQVVLANPAGGQWTITISATSLPSGPQSYSLSANQTLLAGYSRITGVIRDANTLSPLTATVEVIGGPQHSVASASGNYVLTVPGDSTYTLRYSMFGYTTEQWTVYVPLGDSASQNVNLIPRPVVTAMTEDFESGATGWTPEGSGSWGDQWNLSTERAHSATHSYKCGDTGAGSYANHLDARLVSPVITNLPSEAYLTFYQQIEAEISSRSPDSAYDGGVVEISTDSGASFVQIEPGSGYNKTFRYWANSTGTRLASGPMHGNHCFSDSIPTWRQESFDLGAYAGQDIWLRFRFGSDSSGQKEGWYVDDISVFGFGPSVLRAPSDVVIIADGDNIILAWSSTGSPAYRVYSDSTVAGQFTTLVGSTTLNQDTLIGAASSANKTFYVVRSWDGQ